MGEIHVAASGDLVRELVADVLAEFDDWAKGAPSQAASIIPGNPEEAARFALGEVRDQLQDHLQIRLSLTLASYGISAKGEPTDAN